MPNHLLNQISPYLLQHAHNPVDWYPWGDEAFQQARTHSKPIFLSIGYAACHWCHVMAYESFEDPVVAKFLNDHFISIKVDREERPDLDDIYMGAVVSLTGQGGWPLSVFLTPEGKPFYGGTYFPPQPRYHLPSFLQLLQAIQQTWQQKQEDLILTSEQITAHIIDSSNLKPSNSEPDSSYLIKARQSLISQYDSQNGGWGTAPKFPQPLAVEFLLRQGYTGDQSSMDSAFHCLRSMAQGGMHDLVSGGFHRYSTDSIWLVPHFEKMLYDNAQLASVYLHAYLLTRDKYFKQIALSTLEFIQSEMVDPNGAFISSLDADSDGGEGAYYTFTASELQNAAQYTIGLTGLETLFDIPPGGNFAANYLLRYKFIKDNDHLSGMDDQILSEFINQLKLIRQAKPHPPADEKIITSWNAFTITAFANAGRYLKNDSYIHTAQQAATFLLQNLLSQNRLYHTWRNNILGSPAFLEDYAALSLALLTLYEADHNPAWFIEAQQLIRTAIVLFPDPHGGFFDTSHDTERLILRPKNVQDNATPSGNSLMTVALLKLASFTEDDTYRHYALQSIQQILDVALKYPTAFSHWLQAIDIYLSPNLQVVVTGSPNHPNTCALFEILNNRYFPNLIIAHTETENQQVPPIVVNRPLKNNLPTAYFCYNFTCKLPVNFPQELVLQLDEVIPQTGTQASHG